VACCTHIVEYILSGEILRVSDNLFSNYPGGQRVAAGLWPCTYMYLFLYSICIYIV